MDQLNAAWAQWQRDTFGTPIGKLWGRMKSCGVRAIWTDPLQIPTDVGAMAQVGTHEFCEFTVSWRDRGLFEGGVMASRLLGDQRPVAVMEACVTEAARLLSENGYNMELGSEGPAHIRPGSNLTSKKPHS